MISAALSKFVGVMIEDISIALGVACLSYAGYQLHPAICWALVGSVLIAVGLGGVGRKSNQE